jgi:outer membrane protein assembly factor BamB
MLTALLPLLIVPAVQHAADAPAPTWTTRVLVQSTTRLGGCAVGELDAGAPGLEIAAVAQGGQFYVARRNARSWSISTVHRAPGEMIQCTVGELDPAAEGDEIVGVGMVEGSENDEAPGAAWVLSRRDGGWQAELALEAPRLLHAACVVDGELFVGGFDRRVTRLVRGAQDWVPEVAAELPGAAKSMVAARGGVVVACTDGSVVLVRREGGAWTSEVIDKRDSPRARVGATGDSIAVCDDDGTLSILEGGRRKELFKSPMKLRGAVLAELDRTRPGLEAATVGYSCELTVVSALASDAPSSVTPFADSAGLHHLVAANLDDDPELELVTCGHSGLLVLLDLH